MPQGFSKLTYKHNVHKLMNESWGFESDHGLSPGSVLYYLYYISYLLYSSASSSVHCDHYQ